MRLSLLALALVTPVTANALELVEMANPHALPTEALGSLHALRGHGLRDHRLHVQAAAGESWTLAVAALPAAVTPDHGTGPADVILRFTGAPAGDSVEGTVTLADSSAAAVTALPVRITTWPRVGDAATRDDVKNRASWPADPDYHELWDLWGFLADASSHPGLTLPRLSAWEETPCAVPGRHDDCTQAGQAGLAAGMSADRAWGRTVGDRAVTLAVLDSGMRWRNRDVIEQVRLNADELVSCPPRGATALDPASYDVNHDGFFNIRDYDDTEVEDWNTNGLKDPQDIIQGAFGGNPCSDGLDDDGNGFVDDIAGWDFFWDDNDAGDDANFGHGDFEAKLSVGQGDNGVSGIGVCPGCSFIPLRVGDSFIADVDRYAAAVVYAVDNGVSVVQQALGGLGNTVVMHQAVDYAYASGVAVIAAASDLQSYHHNWPANAAHAFMVHAIVYDGTNQISGDQGSWNDATSFVNFNNCTNYGAKLMLSAPGTGCSSESTAKTAGQAGLVYSYFRRLQAAGDPYFRKPLSTEEVYQVLLAGADDIDVPGAETDASALALKKFPSNEGWDEHFGFGRNNAYRSLEVLAQRRIPPEVEITAPRWFDYVGVVEDAPAVEVRARVQNTRTDADVCFRLRWARGVEPTDDQLEQHVMAEGCGPAGAQDVKVYGTLTVADLAPSDAVALKHNRQERTITLELVARVTGDASETAVARRAFFVNRDDDLRPGFPRFLGAGGESSPRLVDLNGDGRDEVVVATGDGRLHAFNAGGGEIQGFPVELRVEGTGCGGSVVTHPGGRGYLWGGVAAEAAAPIVSSPAVMRLADGEAPSIVVATTFGALFAVGADGALRRGFPVCLDITAMDALRAPHRRTESRERGEMGFLSSPAVWDLEGDGVVDIVVGGGDGQLHVWLPDGTVKPGFPVPLRHPGVAENLAERDRIVSSPVLADLDGDGVLEIVIGSNEQFDNRASAALYAVHADGNAHPDGGAFPQEQYPNGEKVWPQMVTKLTPDELLPTIGRGHPTTAAVADLDGDGRDEVLTAGLGGQVAVYPDTRRDELVPSMLYSREDFGPLSNSQEQVATLTMMSSPSVADLDGDGMLDVIDGMVGLGVAAVILQGGQRTLFDHVVGAWDIRSGLPHEGFPAVVEDFQVLVNYPVADVDGDGKAELIAATAGYFINAFRTDGSIPNSLGPDGTAPPAWPRFTGGFSLATPALGDVDGDGKLDMAEITRDGWLFLWSLPGPVDSIQWAGFKHDMAGTGNRRLEPDLGWGGREWLCACDSAGDGAPAGMALLAAVMLRMFRRRQRV